MCTGSETLNQRNTYFTQTKRSNRGAEKRQGSDLLLFDEKWKPLPSVNYLDDQECKEL